MDVWGVLKRRLWCYQYKIICGRKKRQTDITQNNSK